METTNTEIYSRSELLLGSEAMQRLSRARVLMIGIGGVGSWCAEALVRTGVTHITIVDPDKVAPTNINRQRVATTDTVGRPKVEVLRDILLSINPNAEINTLQTPFTSETAESFNFADYDCVVDAIDSLQHKAALILYATTFPKSVGFFSSMGAALKFDAGRIQVAEFWDVNGCPLAATLRRRFRRAKTFPARKFLCVFSDELLENKGTPGNTDSADFFRKASTNGSLMHITASFGLRLAQLVLSHLLKP